MFGLLTRRPYGKNPTEMTDISPEGDTSDRQISALRHDTYRLSDDKSHTISESRHG